MQFDIAIQVQAASAAYNSTQTQKLSPSTPAVVSSIQNFSAVLLGDLASYQSSPSFDYSILMIPSPPGRLALVLCSPDLLMSTISITGSTCGSRPVTYMHYIEPSNMYVVQPR